MAEFVPRTAMGVERVENSPHYRPPDANSKYGYYGDRPIIGGDTRINRGVYLGGHSREAIVVDDTKQPQLQPAYMRLRSPLVTTAPLRYKWRGKIDLGMPTMQAVLAYVQGVMPYNPTVVRRVTQSLKPDQKIALGAFIKAGGGECRHQALFAGYLLERLVEEGLLNGEAHVRRDDTPQGPHAWARFTPSGADPGDSLIIDPAQDFVGTQAQAQTNVHWAYSTPD